MPPIDLHTMRRALCVAAIAALSACAGTNFKWDTVRQLRVGMTEAEVTALMGSPTNVRSTPEGLTWAWAYVDMGSVRSVSVTFVDGKVSRVPQVPESYK